MDNLVINQTDHGYGFSWAPWIVKTQSWISIPRSTNNSFINTLPPRLTQAKKIKIE